VKFFEHPIQWYFNEILGIYYADKSDVLPETEIFELDALQKWNVKKDLMNIHSEEELKAYVNRGVKEGTLPLKSAGIAIVDELNEDIRALKTAFVAEAGDNSPGEVHVGLLLNDLRITGNIEDIYGQKYLTCRFSKRVKYMVRAMINMLLLKASDSINETVFLDDNGKAVELPVLTQSEAIERLRELISIFKKGVSEPLRFTPTAAELVKDSKAVENIFREEAAPSPFSKMPPDLYVKFLYDIDYFADFDIEHFSKMNFDESVYQKAHYDEIKDLGRLLNIIPANHE